MAFTINKRFIYVTFSLGDRKGVVLKNVNRIDGISNGNSIIPLLGGDDLQRLYYGRTDRGRNGSIKFPDPRGIKNSRIFGFCRLHYREKNTGIEEAKITVKGIEKAVKLLD